MENFKINYDRTKISSEEIASRQNFENVLNNFNKAKVPAYKNPWFWGSAGLATVGLTTMITLNAFTLKNENDDKKITLKNNQLPTDTECVKPPVKDENIPFTSYQVNPNKDEKIVLESGTTIEIEKGSLLAEDKNKNVEIQVREFYDQASVFISGIPMDYQKSAFESAGMIEIKGTQNGKEVKIKPEKPIELEMKITAQDDSFGFWKLNQNDKAWETYPVNYAFENESKSKINGNEIELKLVNSIQKLESKIDQKNEELSNLNKPTEANFNIPKKNAQVFDIDFNKSEFPELKSFKDIIFEVTTNNGNDPEFKKNSQKTWSNVELIKQNKDYQAKFSNSKEKYIVSVRPVLQGEDLKKAEKNLDLAIETYSKTKKEIEIEKKKLEIKKEQEELKLKKLIQDQLTANDLAQKEFQERFKKQQEDFNRMDAEQQKQLKKMNLVNSKINEVSSFTGTASFQTNQWGIFNCDKPKAYPDPLKVEVALLWVGGAVAKFKQIFVFNLDKKNRYTYGTPNMPIENLGFNKNDNVVLIGIDEDGNLGYVEIGKETDLKKLEKITFTRKENGTKTVDLLKKLLDENSAVV